MRARARKGLAMGWWNVMRSTATVIPGRMRVATVVAACAAASAVNAYDPFEEAEETHYTTGKLSIVVVRIRDSRGRVIGQGNGFFLSDSGDVLTNRHLFDDAFGAEIVTDKGEVYPVETIVAEDIDGNLLWLRTTIPPGIAHPLPLNRGRPKVGEPIMVVVGKTLMSDGEIEEIRSIPNFGKIISITAPLSNASTGSPVVTLQSEVIGIAVARVVEGVETIVVVPGERIAALEQGKGVNLLQWQSSRTADPRIAGREAYARGLALMWVNRPKKALDQLEISIKKHPGLTKAYSQAAQCYLDLGKPGEAVAVMEQVVRMAPRDPAAYFNLALVLAKSGNYSRSLDVLQEAFGVREEFPQALALMGWVYLRTGRQEKAVEAAKKAIHLMPDLADAHMTLGKAYSEKGRYSWARNALQQALRIEPENVEALTALARVYGATGEYRKELSTLRSARALAPSEVEVLHLLGIAYVDHFGSYDKAIDVLRKAAGLRPDNAAVRFDLGRAYLKAGDRDRARAEQKALASRDPARAARLSRMLAPE